MSLTRIQQVLLAVAILCIVAALAVGVHGRATARRALPPVYAPPRTPPVAPTIVVHVAGEVARPGLYALPRGARAQAAVKAAGGFTGAADRDAVNLAAPLDDGQRIEIPSLAVQPTPPTEPAPRRPTQPLDLNTATTDDLAQLPGIGPELAARIVGYRRQHGPFRSVDALEAVPGIGPKRLAQVRPCVTVR